MTGGSVASGAVTVNTDDASTDEVLAVMVNDPVAADGMVIDVLKAPEAAVFMGKVVAPAITVPVVEALNPVPLTVTADPAGPVAGLSEIRPVAVAAWAAWAGISPKARPSPTTAAMDFKVLIMAIGPPQSARRVEIRRSGGDCRHFPDPKGWTPKPDGIFEYF